jgi:hypothetical protein
MRRYATLYDLALNELFLGAHMENPTPPAFQDTVQIVPENDAPQDSAPATLAQGDDFAATVQVEGDVWPESPDFKSSQSASLFASTQPGPLSVV